MYNINIAPQYVEQIGEDGPYTAERYGVEATSSIGEVYWHFESFRNVEDAEKLADRVAAHVRANPEWTPGEHWVFHRVVYGSLAHLEADLARVDVEAEYGPGSYRPDHPGYIR